jgi:molecular chaperone IbpA
LREIEGDYVYKGIASRHFRQSFALADHLKVKSSEFKDGILRIELEGEVPAEKKTQVIEIH